MKIGLDIGGTLRVEAPSTDDVEEFLITPPNPDSLSTTKWILDTFKPENVFVICRCSKESEPAILAWLKSYSYIDAGLMLSNVFFCREMVEKAGIAQSLGLTYFVDDSYGVLGSMDGVVERRVLFAKNGKYDQTDDKEVVRLDGWQAVKNDLEPLI